MSFLAEFAILNGVNNRPLMLDKLMYDSWKSRMELYMENCENGYLLLESIINGPLFWPMIKENGEIRRKRVLKLLAPEKLQYEADVKETNIILQGVPVDVYALYYHKFAQLINDMHIYQMRLQQFQVNTKFLNSLPPEWRKFVTNVKLVKDLHVTNFDHLFAYLEHHEAHASEIPYNNPQQQSLFSKYEVTYPKQQYSVSHPSTPYVVTYQSNAPQTIYQQPQAISQIDYQPQQTEFPALDSGLVVSVFNKGDDPIDAINKMMSFLSTVHISFLFHEKSAEKFFKPLTIGNDSGWKSYYSTAANALAEVNNHDNVDNNLMNQVVQAMPSSEQSSVVNNSETEITSDSNIIPYSRFKYTKAQQLEPKLYVGDIIEKTNAIVIPDSEETLML
ncbi:hypothetical protein Tco_1215340 [Tanacetum coccineum]